MAPVINMVMMPVLLLSGILLPMTLGPEWLQKVSNFMPTKHVVDAVRNTFLGDFTMSALGWGIAWTFILLAVSPVVGDRHLPARERLSRRRYWRKPPSTLPGLWLWWPPWVTDSLGWTST